MKRSFRAKIAALLLCVLSMIFTSNVVLASTAFKSVAENVATASGTFHPASPDAGGCFPNNAIFTWANQAVNVQVWIGPKENDQTSGWHNNLHVQPFCGGTDYNNYHITYKGIVNGDYVWEVYDSVKIKTTLYNGYSSNESDAADTAASGFAGDVGKVVNSAVANELSGALLNILPDVFANLVGTIQLK